MKTFKRLLTLILLSFQIFLYSQEVPILNYSTNTNGQVQLEVASSEENYYILNVRPNPTGDFEWSSSMTLGEEGSLFVTESLGAHPIEHYQVLEYPIATPADTDDDGIDDMTEFSDLPTQSPLNPAMLVSPVNGTVAINSLLKFTEMSSNGEVFSGGDFLEGQQFVKFVIVNVNSNNPQIYFVNMQTHIYHYGFINSVGLNLSNDFLTGEVIYHPTVVSNNGTLGAFGFNYSFGYPRPFETVQTSHELIAANMPFLRNNLSHYILPLGESDYNSEIDLYNNSRIPILFEDDIYADINYLALNIEEGFGFFRLMNLDETPGSKDVVLYESLPNTLPRVGGIMTSVIQTPLSHVNLRAIQDNLPNAFIRDPLLVDSIANLLDHYVYYRVEQGEYFIREATVDEVNNWFEDIRPDGEQVPVLNLSYTSILPLEEINFNMSDGFGAKCANVATMRNFGFPEGTIPDGFGIPFYFYQEFMMYNGFFDEIEIMLDNPEFQSDLDTRIQMLKDLRSDIKDAEMPQWMLDELQTMQESFPDGTSIRCRSSTNNEDLPGFSGAGLYDSKTQHPEEGHISKSIKQVFASMWNFRAFDERDFYRVDQYIASMGVLCHPNYSDEKANGVGVSLDPIYQTEDTYYLNTQLGEDLVTNPDALSIPEEILLGKFPTPQNDYIVLRYSNLVADEQLIMEEQYLDQIRDYLTVIHDAFKILYNAVEYDNFAMDIEYKITSDDQLVIKQARPWASYWSELEPIISTPTQEVKDIGFKYFPNPVGDYLNIECDCDAVNIKIINLLGQNILEQSIDFSDPNIQIPTSQLAKGIYILNGVGANGNIYFSRKFFKG